MGRFTPETVDQNSDRRTIARRGRCARARRAFSLIELLVVLAVSSLLISLLLPGLAKLRESARRVGCASNMHQIAVALDGFSSDHDDRLPGSYFAGSNRRASEPQQMMMAHRGDSRDGWDGIGRLYLRRYLSGPGAFYCPSYSGEHPFDRYEKRWTRSNRHIVFVNYHYRGIFDFSSGRTDPIENHQFSSFRMERPSGLVLLADGLRTKKDFSHIDGTNILRDDLSVRWYRSPRIYNSLPTHANEPWPRDSIWGQIDNGIIHRQHSSN